MRHVGSPGWARPRTTDVHVMPRQALPVHAQARPDQTRPESVLVGIGGVFCGGAFDALELDESEPELGQSIEQ